MSKTPPSPNDDAADASVGKGRATPTRREREMANKRPLVSDPRASKQARVRMREQQTRVRAGIAAGDERYLPERDKGPQRRYVRDYVDARFSVGELLLPVLILSLIATLIPVEEIQANAIFAVWVLVLITIVDVIILGVLLKKRLIAKFGADRVQPGFRWYATMRAVQFRMLRMPKTQVKLGRFPS